MNPREVKAMKAVIIILMLGEMTLCLACVALSYLQKLV